MTKKPLKPTATKGYSPAVAALLVRYEKEVARRAASIAANEHGDAFMTGLIIEDIEDQLRHQHRRSTLDNQ